MTTDQTTVREIPPPPIAAEDEAAEILRVWVVPGKTQQCNIKLSWEDPGVWGMLLAGVARDVTAAYEQKGLNPQEVFERIFAVFESEFLPATDLDTDGADADAPTFGTPASSA